VVTSLGIDTRTPLGRAMAHMAVTFAEQERDHIRQRTRDALAVERDAGVVLGRPRTTPPDIVARVVREHGDGATAYAIARDLNRDGVPTAQGGKAWHATPFARCCDARAQRLPRLARETPVSLGVKERRSERRAAAR
jgi:DNA invertase Pin-like site-specific DNA recombinase